MADGESDRLARAKRRDGSASSNGYSTPVRYSFESIRKQICQTAAWIWSAGAAGNRNHSARQWPFCSLERVARSLVAAPFADAVAGDWLQASTQLDHNRRGRHRV